MQARERFRDLVGQTQLSWASIDDLIAACDASADFWDAEWLASALNLAKKTAVRKYIRRLAIGSRGAVVVG